MGNIKAKDIYQSEYLTESATGRIDTNVNWLDVKNKGEVVEVKVTPDKHILVGLPTQPKKEDILYSELHTKEQYWRVEKPPIGLNRDTVNQYGSFIKREFDKIANGVWFMNDGEPTFITGEHYYYINYIEIDIGHPDYRERDRLFFYAWEVAKIHPKIKGIILVKPRRMGASWIGAAMLLYKLTKTKNGLGGILSKTGTDAKEFFTEKLVLAYNSLPFWLQPLTSSGSDPKSALVFKRPRESGKKTAKEGVDTSVGLNSKIDWRNTKERSYDSMKLTRLLYDESGKLEGKEGRGGKWIGINLIKQWGVLSKTLGLKKKVGVAFLPSTVDDLTAGGAQFKTLFESSLLANINENGSTPSGLLGYFIPAYDGLEGFIDIYGRSVIEDPATPIMGIDGDVIDQGAKTYLQNERNGQVTERALLELKREMPFTIREAFYDQASESIFDLGKIQSQTDWVEESDIGNSVTKGYFKWKDNKQDTEVEWIQSEKGDWQFSWLPPPDMKNKKSHEFGLAKPVHGLDFAGGVDSYDINITSDNRGSNGAVVFYARTQSSNSAIPNEVKGSFFALYNGRTRYANQFYEQVLMACVYLSSPILAENNKPRILHYFKERGYKEFLSFRPDVHPRNLTKNEKELRGIPSSESTVISHGEILQQYIDQNIGVMPDGSMGHCRLLPLLDDWRKFQIDNRTKFDLTVASGYALMLGLKSIKNPIVNASLTKAFFRKYDNNGSMSKAM